MDDKILEQEYLHLEEIKKKIDAQLEKEMGNLAEQKEELVSQRRTMWEECAHGVGDFDDIIAMASYDENVRKEFGHYVRKEQSVNQLSYLKESPYFGRIDFKEEGESHTEQIYIGRYGLKNPKTREYDIYDWRTPIASMFYDCFLGEAAYECPMGAIRGELTCKRQYRIENGEMKYCYDTNMAVQDELLGQVLSENTDKVLRVIIDTITKEQNQAIREPEQMDMLITGPAGSGKTSVGMHRIAYLLYHNRTRLSSEKIAVLSRNQIFSSYISGILPELGEENVNDVMFDTLVNRGISGEFQRKNYYEQVDYLLKNKENTLRKEGIVLKYSLEFWQFVKEHLKFTRQKKTDFIAAAFLYLDLLQEYCREENRGIYTRTKKKLNRGGALQRANQRFGDEKHTDNMSENNHHSCNNDTEHKQMVNNSQLQGILEYEDMLAISYIRILIGAIRPMSQISHVVLDEAQDYSSLQLMIIKDLYPKSRFTILADVNQAIAPECSIMDMETFHAIFGTRMKQVTLSKSYRSTAPINRFAFDIIGIDNPELYVDRLGKEPEIIVADNGKTAITKLLENISKDQSVGIITCDKESAWNVKLRLGDFVNIEKRASLNNSEITNHHVNRNIKGMDIEPAKLEEVKNIQYILEPEKMLEEKIVVMPIMLAKGLEFDIVIVWDDRNERYWEENKNLKYLMCTRALHELYFVKEAE